jgi:DNA-binding transcriptional LysR family regulator
VLAGQRLIDKNPADIDLINMNPHQLELFYHVAKSKGVSRAVRQMPYGIQQPSISAQVNALERDLGVTLYERRPFKLTSAGDELFRFIEPFFGKFAEVREKLQGAAHIRIGASPIVLRDYLSPVIATVQKQFPRLSLILRAVNQPELIDAIERDELDILISLVPENLSTAICTTEIMELPLVLLVLKASGITSASELWEDGRAAMPLISLGPGELISQKFQETLARQGVSWPPRIEMDSLDLIEKYVEAGYGVGLSIRLPNKKAPSKIRILDLPDFPTVKLALLYRRGPESKIRQAFLDEVKRQAAQLVAAVRPT